MHLQQQTLSAAGDSPWMIPHPLAIAQTIGLGLTFTPAANLTAAVQYTYDDPQQNPRAVTLARAAGVLTITDANHGLIAGDAVQLSNPNNDANNIWSADTSGTPNPVKGWGTAYDIVAITDQNNYTVAVANAGSVAGGGAVRSFRLFAHATVKGTAPTPVRIDGSISSIGAFRLSVSAYTSGSATLTAQQAKGY